MVTVGLASHWPCGTDFSGLSTSGLNGHGKGDEHPTYPPYWGMVHFTFLLFTPSGIVYLGHLYAGESGQFRPLIFLGTVRSGAVFRRTA